MAGLGVSEMTAVSKAGANADTDARAHEYAENAIPESTIRGTRSMTYDRPTAASEDSNHRLTAVEACADCQRHSWLLARLTVRLDHRSRDEGRLLELLALEDEELIEAVGGRRRKQLREEWQRRLDRARAQQARSSTELQIAGVETTCRHCAGYPPDLGMDRRVPCMLHVLGGARRLGHLTARPTVAIVGSVQPTDYGMEMARSLARGLATCGVTVVGAMANGIAAGAHAGTLEADGTSVMVMAGGVDVATPVLRQPLYARVIEHGCAVAEQRCGQPSGRRWCEPARARTIAGLAQVMVVVEAGASAAELRAARVACDLGRTVAAMPGRVTSPMSVGTNALLKSGAPLVQGPEDVLNLLYRASPRAPGSCTSRPWVSETSIADGADANGKGWRWSAVQELLPSETGRMQGENELSDQLQTVLAQVGAGRDTPGKLAAVGVDPAEAMLALSELEIMGLLARGDGGRYVARVSAVS
jgi:DNA processing protein